MKALSNLPLTGELNDLDDVNISSLGNRQQLIYNSTSQKWENDSYVYTITTMATSPNGTVTTEEILIVGSETFAPFGSCRAERTNVTLSASADTTVIMEIAGLTTNSIVDVYTTVDGLSCEKSITTGGILTLVFPQQETETTINIKVIFEGIM